MSENRTKYQTEYKRRNYKRVPLELSYDLYEIVKKRADEKHVSLNGFIKDCIQKQLESDSNFTDLPILEIKKDVDTASDYLDRALKLLNKALIEHDN